MEDKRLILAFALTIFLWTGYTLLFPPQPIEQASVVKEVAAPVIVKPAEVVSLPLAATAVEAVSAQASPIRELTLDTPLYRMVFSSLGGRLKTIELKQYRQSTEDGAPPVYLLQNTDAANASLLVMGDGDFALPDAINFFLAEERESVTLAAGDDYTLRMSTQTASGLSLEKTITLHADRYLADLSLHVTAAQSAKGRLSLALITPLVSDQEESKHIFVGPQTLTTDELQQDKLKDLLEQPVEYGTNVVWTGFTEKYFMTALVPLQGSAQSVTVLQGPQRVENLLWSGPLQLDAGRSVDLNYAFFFGPKDVDILKMAGHGLDEGLDLGMFAPIAEPLLYVLKFFYSFIGNYGWAIILLTVIIKILFWPLTHKSYSSMKAMQKLQPKLQQLREKFKNDKQRLNTEMMSLYKEHRVNPMGGCLPMLVQIPVFFALYRVLLGSIELRHAPFAFWLQDLSAADPYYITPLIMGATMFLQQKMTPSTMDPAQAKLMMFMPIVFTFLFLNFPSGLVIYWLVNNLLSITQQLVINRRAEA